MREILLEHNKYLEETIIPIRIASKTESGWPVVVSLWFLHLDGLLYCATQKSARIVKYLKNDPRCGFEIAEDRPPYCGLRGQANAEIDEGKGIEILKKLLVRYLGSVENILAEKLLAKSEQEVAIILEPKQVFTWDFSSRMANLPERRVLEKICP